MTHMGEIEDCMNCDKAGECDLTTMVRHRFASMDSDRRQEFILLREIKIDGLLEELSEAYFEIQLFKDLIKKEKDFGGVDGKTPVVPETH